MITVIGGTYREIDYDKISHEIFGSGFRACKFLLENKCKVFYYTSGNQDIKSFLEMNKNGYSNFEFQCTEMDDAITFKYSFSLDDPLIFPTLPNIKKTIKMEVESENVVCYGTLESDYILKGSKVVYDPQTAVKPKKFSDFGSADELVYIVNISEAESIAGSTNLEGIKRFFFEQEKASAIVLKNGPYGATIFFGNNQYSIPSFITTNVHKIGSGDIFTASFAYYWIEKKLAFDQCAEMASLSTAYFCDLQVYVDVSRYTTVNYMKYQQKLLSNKQVYLAGPFFSIAELILVDKIRRVFLNFGIKVFSPFHDIGLGNEDVIAKKDLEGLAKSDVVFCIFDNLDSGTLIESGFALASGKPIIGYHRTCDESKLLMLSPGNIKLFTNLTTAIYNTIWTL